MLTPANLHPYQREALEWLYAGPNRGLIAQLGAGKTIEMLSLIRRLKNERRNTPTLVIGSIKIVAEGWPSEMAKWSHTAGLTYSLIHGTAKQRLKAVAASADIHLINRENVTWLVRQYVERANGKWRWKKDRWPFKTVIVDEFTSMGDSGSERFKHLRLVRPFIERFHGMTATPTAEGYMKMFAMTWLLDQGERFGSSIAHYRETYFTQNQYTKQWTIRPEAPDLITAKVSDLYLLHDNVLPRDTPTVIDRVVRLTDEQMAQYAKFRREAILEIASGETVEAVHAAALATKLLQLASGFVYSSEADVKERRAHFIHTSKIDGLKELVEEADGENLIVAYWFKPSLALLQKAFPKAVVMDATGKAIKPWNEGKIKMLLLHPQSAGEGLNLQAGGATVVFYDIPAPLEKYIQTIGRVDRQGQTKPVKVYHMVAAGTDDEMAVQRLKDKRSVQDGFFELMKQEAKP